MKTKLIIGILLLCSACGRYNHSKPTVVTFNYRQNDIQKSFDTLYHHQQTSSGLYMGFIEQALAICPGTTTHKDTITQDVLSSMYLNLYTGNYDCVTTTTFCFEDGNISATGMFHLTPGDTIAPDHDFPITGGSGAYHNIYGTYTRKYKDGIYHIELRYDKLD
ncbi:MAG: hypothetical protein WC756_14965 [Taibaiella sp.]|jgi:hypothetical protein